MNNSYKIKMSTIIRHSDWRNKLHTQFNKYRENNFDIFIKMFLSLLELLIIVLRAL